MKLNLGCGCSPVAGYVNHDKWKHSPHVDVAWDLEVLPWPWPDGEFEEVKAFDVFEHLRPWKIEVHEWLGECWRILGRRGVLEMRLPSYDHPQGYGFRDPTHYRVFHPESFDFFCPKIRNTVHAKFGKYYWGPDYNRWWHKLSITRDWGDWRYLLMKI